MDNKKVEEVTKDEIKDKGTQDEKREELTVEQQLQKLSEQNQNLMNEVAKLKKASDKNASEASEWKKKYNATLSAQEQASNEKAEREAEREEQFNKLLRENQVNKFVRQYMTQGYSEDLAQKAAEAMYDGDTDTFFKIQSDAVSAIVKKKEDEWIKSRPDIHAGTGGTQITKEQFDKMSVSERTQFANKNPDAYEKLMGRK